MADLTARELLLKAADHIERWGLWKDEWVPDSATDPDNPPGTLLICPACAGGAMAIELTGGADWSPIFIPSSKKEVLEEAMRMLAWYVRPSETDLDPLSVVTEWSDDSTQDEVVEGLRAAATIPEEAE